MIHSCFIKTKTFLISFLFIVFSMFFSVNLVNAKEISEVEIGDFTYNLDEDTGTATVIKYNPGWWSKHFNFFGITIPESVKYKKKKYTVNKISENFSKFSDYPRGWMGMKSYDKIKGKSIEFIGDYAFDEYSGCCFLTSIDFPNATHIGNYSFGNQSHIKKVNLPKAIVVGKYAFKFCTGLFVGEGLSEVNLPNANKIGEYAFYHCESLKTINAPNVVTVEPWAFCCCFYLTNVNLENTVKIDNSAFSQCESLKNINLPKATYIGSGAFRYCKSLECIEAPNLNSCGENIFYGLPKGVTFKVPKSMKDFGLEKLPNSDKVNIVYIEKEKDKEKISLGEKITNNGIVNYVDENGRTVADITEYGMIWLKESSDGTSAWYGIDNSDGTFKIGSKFWVKWLSPKIDREEFEEYYNKLDDEHKKKVDKNHLWIFLTGVTDPDGNEYTNFYGNINYYIQIGEDWDKDDINVVFISGNKDSVLDVSYVTLECPEGKGEFAKVVMKHFSPYAVYDEKDEIKTSNVSKSASIKTGESVSKLTFMFYISLFLVAFLNRKKVYDRRYL